MKNDILAYSSIISRIGKPTKLDRKEEESEQFLTVPNLDFFTRAQAKQEQYYRHEHEITGKDQQTQPD